MACVFGNGRALRTKPRALSFKEQQRRVDRRILRKLPCHGRATASKAKIRNVQNLHKRAPLQRVTRPVHPLGDHVPAAFEPPRAYSNS